jgi:hypothetical protein
MPGAVFRATREWLGIGRPEMARILSVREDTIKAWEAGKRPIPYRIPGRLSDLEWEADLIAARSLVDVFAQVEDQARPGLAPMVCGLYMEKIRVYGRRWWRHLVVRTSWEHPGVLPVLELLTAPDEQDDEEQRHL